jgi:tetratricopeptide (TPR) repeat protein
LHTKVRTLFQRAKNLELRGLWQKAIDLYRDILLLDPTDSYSHLALAKLLAKHDNDRDQSAASRQFQMATEYCPDSIHLWQAWGLHEANVMKNIEMATTLFETALTLDRFNPYVLHAYGYMVQHDNATLACELWQRALLHRSHTDDNDDNDSSSSTTNHTTTAALVCSYGTLLIGQGEYDAAKQLYETHVPRLSGRPQQQMEVYLALSYLVERYYHDYDSARHYIDQALYIYPSNSLAQVARARLAHRQRHTSNTTMTTNHLQRDRRTSTTITSSSSSSSLKNTIGGGGATTMTTAAAAVAEATTTAESNTLTTTGESTINSNISNSNSSSSFTNLNSLAAASLANAADDGRVYNAWAKLNVKQGRYVEARDILQKGYLQYPNDAALLQAYGAVEYKLGNWTGAKRWYDASLALQLSAPCLVSLALLELELLLDHQSSSTPQSKMNNNNNFTSAQVRFEQALTVDRRHGPAYNAYARAMWRYTRNETATRTIYQRGVAARCNDAASIYHGYAQFELHYFQNYERAYEILRDGTKQFRFQHSSTDSPHRDRAAYLFHTLGMLELMPHRNSPKDALAAFQQGMDYCGKSSPLLLGSALSYIKLGSYEEARTALERSVRRDPCHAQAWHAWAVFETRSGNLETAKILLECGVRKCPRYGALWEALAVLKGRLGQVNEARICYEKGIAADPTRSTLFQNWAALENRQENYNAAKALITKALTMNKRSSGAWIIASEIERQLGNMGLANLLLRRGIEYTPQVPSLYRTLGENLVRDGQLQQAREIFEQGLAVDPMYAPLYHSLAELEARLFNVAGLAALHQRTTALFNTNLLDRPATFTNNTSSGSSSTSSNNNNNLWEQQQPKQPPARKKYSFKVPQSVTALAETIVGGAQLSNDDNDDDNNDSDDDKLGRSDRDIVGSLPMDDAFLKTVIYGDRSDDPEDL